jgi:hypothetical protein
MVGHRGNAIGGGNIVVKLPAAPAAQAFLAATRRIAQPAAARLVFGLDATASREATWDAAAGLQGEMFKAVPGGLAVQLVYFGGVDRPRAGPFLTSGSTLARYMTTIRCRSGNTQIAGILRHVASEHARQPIAALVYIGDTVEEEPETLYGLAKTIAPVPAFMFWENLPDSASRTAATFKQIASITGCAMLEFNRSAPQRLAGLLGAIGAYAAGGVKALEAKGTAEARLLLGYLR